MIVIASSAQWEVDYCSLSAVLVIIVVKFMMRPERVLRDIPMALFRDEGVALLCDGLHVPTTVGSISGLRTGGLVMEVLLGGSANIALIERG